jgi:hypothetical protein
MLNLRLIDALYEKQTNFGPSFLPCGKAGGLQIRRCQGLAVDDYGGTLGALSLKPSGFCNIGGTPELHKKDGQ